MPATRYLPNVISVLRFPLAAAFALVGGTGARFAIVAIAAFSDWIDGPLARHMGSTSRTGEWLDPLADKAFMVTALVVLARDVGLAWWVLPLLLLRDIGVALGALVLLALRKRAAVAARRAGKWVTWLQFLAIGVLLLEPALAPWIAPPVALLGVVALVDYARALRASSMPHARSGGFGRAAR